MLSPLRHQSNKRDGSQIRKYIYIQSLPPSTVNICRQDLCHSAGSKCALEAAAAGTRRDAFDDFHCTQEEKAPLQDVEKTKLEQDLHRFKTLTTFLNGFATLITSILLFKSRTHIVLLLDPVYLP